ncbi:hypothetical protein [Brachybacterium vulturis]|uniref:hypothetical protein n=1 Tax=Brachybacterium vulturis TaxID=2017484 RepID=UPI00373534E3
MSLDPHSDTHTFGPEDGAQQPVDPKLREAQELEARMRRALATKEDPLHDDESTSERLRRLASEGARSAESADEAPSQP